MYPKNIIVAGILALLLVAGLVVYFLLPPAESPAPAPKPAEEPAPVATSTQAVIGNSVENRDIEVYTFGAGSTDLLFVGGMHGGYEWNSILLAYEMIDHFRETPSAIPENLTVHIIPNLNPDGLYTATGLTGRFVATDIPDRNIHSAGIGRFNANDVDLNRNFACNWAPGSGWRGQTVSAGSSPFSEPEAVTLRNYVNAINPAGVVFWHSQANNVYASECNDGVLPETLTLMNTYAQAGSYGAVPVFDAYPITGDAEGWLASIGIPAVTVELETRESTEWSQNLAGTMATLELYSSGELAR